VDLLHNPPEKGRPFVDGDMYVHYAIFAAHFGEPNVEARMHALKQLSAGIPLFKLAPSLTDRAWLCLVYVTFCANLSSISSEKGWYYSNIIAGRINHVEGWMGVEGKMIRKHEQATDAITKALKPLEESMDSYTAGDEDGDGNQDTDSEDSGC